MRKFLDIKVPLWVLLAVVFTLGVAWWAVQE